MQNILEKRQNNVEYFNKIKFSYEAHYHLNSRSTNKIVKFVTEKLVYPLVESYTYLCDQAHI